MDAGILPVKNLSRAKHRLAEHLDDADRLEVARALLEDSLALCRDASFLTWWVASDDEEALTRAHDYGFNTVKDQTGTLNGALQQAVLVAMAEGATSVTMIPSDIPLAYSGDLRDLLDTGSTSEVVVVPSARDGGTNGLYLRPPDILAPRFGTASMQAHLMLAERLGFRCSILVLPRLALDIDTIEDVDEFLTRERTGESKSAEILAKLRPHVNGAES
ncbi:MAG TPA: 2-phospho-L-lactate guanylyltransferase [Actinomycetota bacterium]|nr:2-phospho-L-lactate guanylyltransferase [Actinomycetota bacterium]